MLAAPPAHAVAVAVVAAQAPLADAMASRVLSEEVAKDWAGAQAMGQRGLHRATPLEAFGGVLAALVCAVLLVVGATLVYQEAPDAFPLPAYIAVAVVAGVAPFLVLNYLPVGALSAASAPRALPTGAGVASGAAAGGPGETAPYRNTRAETLRQDFEGATTLREAFVAAAAKHGGRKAQGWRDIERKVQQTVTFTNREGEQVTRQVEKWVMSPDYKWNTFAELSALVKATGAGLWAALPEGGAEGDADGGGAPARRIGIFADTKPSWMQVALGAFRHGIPIVTVYATLGADAVAYAITQTDVSVMVVDPGLLGVLASCQAGRAVPTGNGDETYDAHCRSLTTVVTLGEVGEAGAAHVASLTAAGVEVRTLAELQAAGRAAPVADSPASLPTPHSVANIQYTSGSTGLPKGVVIRHSHLVAAVAGMGAAVPDLSAADTYIAYLPLAHILELSAELNVMMRGGAIGYASKETLVASSQRIPVPDAAAGVPKVAGDAACLKPTVLAAVPAIMDKIRRGISAKVAAKGPVVQALFNWGFSSKLACLAAGQDSPFWNAILFDKIRTEALGGRVRLMLSGGGPLNKETQQFMNVVFCCPVGQGYGLTETMGAGTITHFMDKEMGTVGAPVLSAEVKLVDWAEGGYSTAGTPPRGEIVVSGPIVASGYWQLPEKTAADFRADEDGRVWFYTGDIGEVSPSGVFSIIDRKKDLVKLATAEYISLGKIESTMKLCKWVTNLMAYGDGDAPHAVAVVTPDVDAIRRQLPGVASVEDMADSPEVKALILADIKRIAKEKHFNKMETPQALLIATEEWTPESGLVTASLKLKRKALLGVFQGDLQRLYKGRA